MNEETKEMLNHLLQDINDAQRQDIFTHQAHNWINAFKLRIERFIKGEKE